MQAELHPFILKMTHQGTEKSCWGCRALVPAEISFCDLCYTKAADKREGADLKLESLEALNLKEPVVSPPNQRKFFKQVNKEHQNFPSFTKLGKFFSDEWSKVERKSSMLPKI